MDLKHKATGIELFSFKPPHMRTFHLTWFAFFLCFFGWFGIAPLMAVVREELGLTQAQVGNTIIASVAITILARLAIGWVCDRFGPRRTYAALLILGALPVMGIGLASDYTTFLLFRLAIGVIGASFVITQFHTSLMFAPNVVGTANATTAGWGNLGGGVTQMAMPLIFSAFLAMGVSQAMGWRLAMVVPGVLMILTGIAYYCLTQDTPDGNFQELRARGELATGRQMGNTFWEACRDHRVWALFVIYAACFGIELTINNIAALYFTDYFSLDLKTAGLVASLFGLMNIFARSLGGILGDRAGIRFGLRGRVFFLVLVLLAEGMALMVFSRMNTLALAIGALIVFSVFVQMSEGATYSVVPFINKRALGSVAGIVGAGGNTGAVLAGFLFKIESLPWPQALLILGMVVSLVSMAALLVRFSPEEERAAREEMERRLASQAALAAAGAE
ncbi:MFS transporter [Litorilinea aerophila]|uniref:MFS transporter n=1 Tax=Litorilinea aerophila TaxID=1204385 RepID=A0A540VDC6_9CHLR|nr:MFS transporter [Litorilinea aerophila]MCC9077462.1 MFS transporter [Litorilinea aerophila]